MYLLASSIIVGATLFFYVLLPLLNMVTNSRRVGRALCANFPLVYKDFHPVFGNIPCHPGPNQKGLMTNIKNTAKNPRAAVFYFGSLRPVLILHHPETLKPILRTAQGKTAEDYVGYKLLFDWIGDGLLLSKGKKWFRNRRLLTPGFHFDILKPYVKIYNECSDQLIKNIESATTSGESVDIFGPVSLCTLEIILKCAFSSSEMVQIKKSSPYIEAVLSMATLILDRAFKPWLYPDWIYYLTGNGRRFKKCWELSHKTATDVITERRKKIAEVGEENMLKQRR